MEGGQMIYYIMTGHIFTIFLSMSHLTSINFESKVQDYVGGQIEDFKIYELNKGKSLVLEAKKKDFSRNFITFLKDKKYHYNLKYNEKFSNKDVVIKNARPCSYFSLIKETSDFQLFECPKSLFFINKRKSAIRVNELIVKSKSYLSKGPPLYINNELIYYQGRTL
jgi:hypothetical protein